MQNLNKSEAIEEVKQALLNPNTSFLDPLTVEDIENKRSDRRLKKGYAKWIMVILIIQLLIMNIVFILTGFKLLVFDKYVIDIYLTGTLAEVFGIVLVITKNLFPQKK